VSEATTFSAEQTHVSGRRFWAHYIDATIFTFAAFVASIPFLLVYEVSWIVFIILAFTVGHVYFFAWIHRSNGVSPGKRLLGIKVVDAHGRTPSFNALVKRSVPLVIEYFYVIAFVGMMSSDYRQRFGDRWGETFVVRG